MRIKNYLSLLSVLVLVISPVTHAEGFPQFGDFSKLQAKSSVIPQDKFWKNGPLPQSSAIVRENEKELLFESGMADNPAICIGNVSGDIFPTSKMDNLKAFLDYTCQDRQTSIDPISYCECINSKFNDKSKTKANKVKSKELVEDLYAAKLTEVVSQSLANYLKNSEIIGYSAILNKNVRNKVAGGSCTPGTFKKGLEKISSKSPTNKSCLKQLDNSNFEKLFSRKLEKEKNNYSRLNIGVSLKNNGSIYDVIEATDKSVAEKFRADLEKSYSNRPLMYKPYDVTNLRDLPEDFNDFSKQERAKVSKIFELQQKIKNGEKVPDELYLEVQKTYLTNPIIRRLQRNLELEQDLNISNAPSSSAFLRQGDGDIKRVDQNKKDNIEKIVNSLISRMNFSLKLNGKEEVRSAKEFDDAQMFLLEKYTNDIFVDNCEKSFEHIEKFCSQSQADFIAGLNPFDLTNLIDESLFVIDAELDQAKKTHVTNGLNYCHLRRCDKDKNGKIPSDCATQASSNADSGKKVPIDSKINKRGFNVVSSIASDDVIDTKIIAASSEGSFGGSSDVVEGSIASTNHEAFVGGGTVDEPMLDTNIDSRFNSENSTFTTNNPFNSATTTDASAMATNFSNPSSLDSSIADVQSPTSDSTPVAEEVKPSTTNEKNDSYKKELASINEKLSSYKQESENARKELEDFKAQKYQEDQERALAEKERAMRNNLSSLEEKIRKLENEKANIAQNIPSSKYSNPRSSGSDFQTQAGFESGQISEGGGSRFAAASPGSSSGIRQALSQISGGGKMAFSGGARGSSIALQSVISLTGKDDPSLKAKVMEVTNGGKKVFETLYVTIGDKYYRVTPQKDDGGNLVIVDGEVALNFEIATPLSVEAIAKNPSDLERAPAALDSEPILIENSENALRYNDLKNSLRDDK